jgi:hypothetical protein
MTTSQKRQGPRSRSIPITGVSLFIAERKVKASQDHTDLTKVQLFALLNDEWNGLDSATKETYERRADYSRRIESRRVHRSTKQSHQSRVSPYSVFMRDRHELLKKSSPEMTVGDRAQLIAVEWKTMAAVDKIPFINAAKRETRKMQRRSVEEDSAEESESQDSDF